MKRIKYTLRKALFSVMLVSASMVVSAQSVVETMQIEATESVKVAGGTTIKNLIVNADKNTCGQLVVEGGVVQVEKLTYRFKLLKDDWTMLAFPSDIPNLLEPLASNLSTLGYKLNIGVGKVFQLKNYNTASGLSDGWKIMTKANIIGNKAYIISLMGNEVGESDIVEFYFYNVNLDIANGVNRAVVDVDLTGKPTQQNFELTVSALNASSNPLKINIYNDQETAPQPIDYVAAVADAKLIFTEDNQAFRIVLPTDEVCKVLVMDKQMKKTIQAIEYVSPAMIPVSEFKKGSYKLLMEYGGVTGIKDLKVK